MRLSDGSCYEGDLVDAQPHGHGIKKVNGERYKFIFLLFYMEK